MADIFVRLHSGRLMVVVLDRFVVIVSNPAELVQAAAAGGSYVGPARRISFTVFS
jgi:hypothetical protein